ncbi:MAG: 3-deoxy-8-phosphooctulonate synthase [Candidatus Latescibacteria bacterium]|nr:3-deoxy-8-phosphooctulonate synthase [Candidatus Latescibacterota bacterium]NIM22086.1 3-deoxy-8-phosphooctulonate synthase [Candidatus Latescibacterota bacterium]NIM66105.1 3-deoxy-8-phosphooctulonate synthase [Candidatus Latescibacterota bacterium]NIO02513.1 3-deoxy-8-phosphooctulonate synthase [Candidatus Latescibacterota bacterium]NIO29424.1 3-deoxy-8-phosphooctulonate synthase [Candidatus Latescibacterota bacterium]
MNPVTIGQFICDDNSPPVLIAGPCVIENANETCKLAEAIQSLPIVEKYQFVFKASYLKDNRSSGESYRGPGLHEGLDVMRKIKDELGCPVLSDVHGIEEVIPASEVLDVVQIPAFLSRQTRLVEAAAKHAKAINVKKGQFLAPEDVKLIVVKIENAGGHNIILTERGTVFGYHDLVVDFRSFPKLKANGYPVIFDVTHSLQKPGGLGDRSGGEPEHAGLLARAAAAVPCDGLFIETHFEPSSALSDSSTMVPFSVLDKILEDVHRIHSLSREIAHEKPAIS